MSALELRDLEVAYGGVPAVKGLSLSVAPGEIVGLIGPNGAGKSSTLHAIMGLVPARKGDIRLDGASIRGRCQSSRRAPPIGITASRVGPPRLLTKYKKRPSGAH